MRFVLAIAAFLVAAVMIGPGIAERTVLLEPDSVDVTVAIDEPTAFVLVTPEALAAHPGKQSLRVSGAEHSFVALGREHDVRSWLGDLVYTEIHVDETGELVAATVDPSAAAEETDGDETSGGETESGETPRATPENTAGGDAAAEPEPGPSPVGADLWLDEFSTDGPVSRTLDLPDDIALLVADDGTAPAPDTIELSWPLDNSTPWAGPLIVGGSVFFAGGVVLLVLGFVQHRRGRGPRRKGGTPPPVKRSKLPTGPRPKSLPAGRRSIGRAPRAALASLVLVPVFALTSCSADYWPQLGDGPDATVTPTASPDDQAAEAAEAAEIAPPAVTEPQLRRIMTRIAEAAAEADEGLDAKVAATRFHGPALTARKTNYAIRKQLPDQPGPVPVSAESLEVVLPQQSIEWPRSVFVVAKNGDDPTVPQTALWLVQESPRDDYRVEYAVSMAPEADFPRVAPATVGAPKVSEDNKGLLAPPAQLAPAFAAVLAKGDAAKSWERFETEDDPLVAQLGLEGQQQTQASSDSTVTVSFETKAGAGPALALGTVDAGALVVGTVEQLEKAVPNEGGTVGFTEGGPRAALSGFTSGSAKGVQHTTGVQLLFYVPGVGSDEPIRILGWAENLIAASEVP